ncbi:hypothetical protein [Streptomyces albipurpureus]|uniref:Uncharacterized protein n=1 Tax=Streptomyces albipurpureus TaxID=2897419 RepID=A0ABT0UIY1_9ACTN|nr:hypothetical protein [Streptomyces sp. CWNU-1]MCM2388291.1 hypothetical protein [Streptomyces sp. CWNU-1]
MLPETMTALAAAGGTAVVQAAGTDAWAEFRQRVARWLSRGNAQRETAELERLDQSADALETAATTGLTEAEREHIRQESGWHARIEALLESLDVTEQKQAAEELRAVLARHSVPGGVSAHQGGLAVGASMGISAEQGSIAAGVIHGGAHIGPTPSPAPSQG